MKAILVYRTAALGDYIFATPAIAEVRRQFPAHQIILLTTQTSNKVQRAKVSVYSGGASSVPWVDLTVPHLVDEYFVLADIHLSSLLQMRRRLIPFDFEVAIMMIDPVSHWRGRLKKLVLLKFVAGWVPVLGWRAPGWFAGKPTQLREQGILMHHILGAFQFLREMSPPREPDATKITFDLRPDADAEQWASQWRADNLQTQRLVALAPGSIQPHKRWPSEKFAELTKALLLRFADIKIIVMGTLGDKALGDVLAAIDPGRVANLAGVTSIAQSAALLKHTTLLVGNDGGAMHLGNAMGTRVIALIPGIEYPDSIEPWNNKDLAIRHAVSCAPCYNMFSCPLGHNACMKDIPVAAVLKNCMRVLGSTILSGSV